MVTIQYNIILECEDCGDKEVFTFFDKLGMSNEEIIDKCNEGNHWNMKWNMKNNKLYCWSCGVDL